MCKNTTGEFNTATGARSLQCNTTGGENVSSGYNSLSVNTTGCKNVAFGKSSLEANTTADNNTAVGFSALKANTTGATNTALGSDTLKANTTGDRNVAIGHTALTANVDGCRMVAIGQGALSTNTTGDFSVGIGYAALAVNTASSNVAIGCGALGANTTAACSVVVGHTAGSDVTTGKENVFVGGGAGGGTITTGCRNVFIGTNAGRNGNATSNSVAIGYEAYTDNTDGNVELVIAHNTQGCGSNTFTFGKASNKVHNNFATNASWTRNSDLRLKKNIKNSDLGLDFIDKLRPVTYNWKPSNEIDKELTSEYNKENNKDTETTMNGLIAQEVKQALLDSGVSETEVKNYGVWTENKNGIQEISREMFVIPLINAIKELSETNKDLKSRIEALENS